MWRREPTPTNWKMINAIASVSRHRNRNAQKSSRICSFIDHNRKEYQAKLERMTRKVVVRKRSFEDIEDTYKKNEQDMQLFFKAFRYHLAHHSAIRVKHDPSELIIKKADENKINFSNDPNADKYIKDMIEKAQVKQDERRIAMENFKNDISIINSKKEKNFFRVSHSKTSRNEKTEKNHTGPYKMSAMSSSKNAVGLKVIRESESDNIINSRGSSIFRLRRKSTLRGRPDNLKGDREFKKLKPKKDEIDFVKDDNDVDLILNTLKDTLDELYNDRAFLKNLYNHRDLCRVPNESSSSEALSKHIDNLKISADQLYAQFFRTKKYIKMVRQKVDGYKVTKMMAGLIENQIPAAELASVFRFKEIDDYGNYYDVEDVHKYSEKDSKWSDPNFPAENWAFEMPKFKKGFNSKFSRINMKDINPEDKKLDDYFNRKQVMACTTRGLITQPIKNIIQGQTDELEIKEEKKPSSMYCIFDKTGTLYLT